MGQNLTSSFRAIIDNLNKMSGIDLYKSEARALLTGMSTMLDNIVIDADDERYLRHHINSLLEHEGIAEAELHAMHCGEYDAFDEDGEPIWNTPSYCCTEDELPF
jgi:hypothetical protein